MFNLTLTVGQIKITPLFWSLCLGFVISSFSIWRKLIKEDYRDEDIFGVCLCGLLGGIFFGYLCQRLIKMPILGAFWGSVLLVVWRLKSFSKNVWEVLDCFTLPWFYFLFFAGLGLFLTNFEYFNLAFILISLIGFYFLTFFKKKYRSFSWYKSGKVGFVFWACSFCSFFLLLGLDFFGKSGLYWTEFLWLVSAAVAAVIIYYRAEVRKK